MTEQHPVVERYVARLAEGLDRQRPEDRAEIVQEIRHHIADAVAAGKPLEAVLESLGSADGLARAYAVESLLDPRADHRRWRPGRSLKLAGLVAVGSITTLFVVVMLGSIALSFVASGVVVFVIGVLEAANVHLPGVQTSGVPPVAIILLGPVMFTIGVAAGIGLLAYVRFLTRALRAVLPPKDSPRGGGGP